MAVWDLYSKRRKRELGQAPDVFAYDIIPDGLRAQIVHMWDDAIGVEYRGHDHTQEVQDTYLQIAQILRREYGLFRLSNATDPGDRREARRDLVKWFLEERDNERVLDAIELTFRIIEAYCGSDDYLNYRKNNNRIAQDAVNELNTRFKEHGIGYQFEEGQLLRIDSQLVHSEVVIPALVLLRGKHLAGAQEEFLSAFEHYRHGKKEEALVDACKSFESTMKAICDKRGWAYDKNKASASELVNICLTKELVPPFWQGHFSALRAVLQSGIPTARNRNAGHGAGTEARPEPPDELVAYVLHMTASTIVFLTESEKRL